MPNSVIKLPGLVDVHVHLREPGATQKEDFETGTRAAVAGGYTQVLDMPNNTPPTTTPKDLENKIELSKNRIWCDLGFNFGATAESIQYFKTINKKVFGLKVYMGKTTGPLLIDKEKEQDIIFASWPGPLPIMVHATGGDIKTAIRLANKYKKRLHICHVTGDQIKFIKKAKQQGVKITCEVTPHHLFLNENDLIKLGTLGFMKPPLESANSQQLLWENLDVIDMVATDHAPHTIEEKKDKADPKFGVPGLETALPLMLNAVFQKKLSMAKLIDMMATRPRKVFKLPAEKNTYVIVDTQKVFQIGTLKLQTKCGWTPFANQQGRGQIQQVVIRGKTVYKNGNFASSAQGILLKPQL